MKTGNAVYMSQETTGKLSRDGWALKDYLQESKTLSLCHTRYESSKLGKKKKKKSLKPLVPLALMQSALQGHFEKPGHTGFL